MNHTRHPLGRLRRLMASGLAALVLAAPTLMTPSPALAEPSPGASGSADPALRQTVTADEKVAHGPAEVTKGHVDVGPRLIDGRWTLMARDDTANPPVWRSLDDLVMRVADASLIDVPNEDQYSFLGDVRGHKAYVIPQTQDQRVAWLGWNTQSPEIVKSFPRGADLILSGHEGPGSVHLFIQNGFDAPLSLYDSTKSQAQSVHMEPNTHVHANWVFEKPGVHTLSIEVRGRDASGNEHRFPTRLRFAVGDAASADAARAMGASSASPGASTSTASSGSASPATSTSTTPAPAAGNHGSPVRTVAVVAAAIVLAGLAVGGVLTARRSRRLRAEAWKEDGDE